MASSSQSLGPFRATQLWNALVEELRLQTLVWSRSKSKWKWRESEVFTGSEVSEWMKRHLRQHPSFGCDVSKDQANRLLTKMMKAGVFESTKKESDVDFVASSNRLYRLLPQPNNGVNDDRDKNNDDDDDVCSSSDVSSTLFTSVYETGVDAFEDEHNVSLSSVRRIKSTSNLKFPSECKARLNRAAFQALPANSPLLVDNEALWTSALAKRLTTAVGQHILANIDSVQSILTVKKRLFDHVLPNMSRVASSGVVRRPLNSSEVDLVPTWLLSAMKCLANWPRPLKQDGVEREWPKYPGFVQDVFKCIEDYFKGLQEPLVPKMIFEAMANVERRVAKELSNVVVMEEANKPYEVASQRTASRTRTRSLVRHSTAKTVVCPSVDGGIVNPAFSLSPLQDQTNRLTQDLEHLDLNLASAQPLQSSLSSSVSSSSSAIKPMSRRAQEKYWRGRHQCETANRKLVEALKFLVLLLSPDKRRATQLLLKFMLRVSSNRNLSLKSDASNRFVVLESFAHIILRDDKLKDEELASKRLVSAFLQHYDQIWKPPIELRRDVEEQVYRSLVFRRLETGEDPFPVTYCTRISGERYESDKQSELHQALNSLLTQIIDDKKMSLRDKQKKLSDFKTAHPEVYFKRFPNEHDEPLSVKSDARSLQRSVSRIRDSIRL